MSNLSGWRRLRYHLFAAREHFRFWLFDRHQKARFERAAAKRSSDRLFVIGNGPSLAQMDLGKLATEDCFVVNMAERFDWVHDRGGIFYVATDKDVVSKYEGARPALSATHFFYPKKVARLLAPEFAAQDNIFTFTMTKEGIPAAGLSERPWVSVACGPSVLTSAVQLGWAMGYREIYIIGCDLNYQGPSTYAFDVPEAERQRDADRDDRTHRRVIEEFTILHREIEQRGGILRNAGIGGRLDAMPRVEFDSLFDR